MKKILRKQKTWLKMSNELKDQEQADNLTLQMGMMVATPAVMIGNLIAKNQLQVQRSELENGQPEERLPNQKLGKP